MQAETSIEQIQVAAQNHGAELRMVRTITVGQWIRQGDVFLRRVEANHPRGKETANRQLAPGKTKGSRHIVEGDVTICAPTTTDPLVGPIVKADERFTVAHPEHAHVSLPSGTYATTFQRDFAQEERARVMD